MRRALATGTLVGFSLTAVGALGQKAPPAPAPVAPAPVAPAPAPPASAAPAAPGSAAPARVAPSPSEGAPVPPPSGAAAAQAAPTSEAPAVAPAPPVSPALPAEVPPADTQSPAGVAPSPSVSLGTPSTSGTSPAVAPAVDRGEKAAPKKKASDPWQDGHALGAEGAVYVSGRLGDSSIQPSDEEHVGLGFDVSAWFSLSREYAFGFGLTHADLGNVTTGTNTDAFDADYDVTAAYLGARAFPWRGESAEIFLGLRVGLGWQDLDARGIRTLQPNILPPEAYACSGVSGPALALGAGFGGALRLGARSWLVGHLDVNGYKMTSEVVDGCAPGIGSVTTVSAGAGFLYAFDLGADAKLDAARPARAQTW